MMYAGIDILEPIAIFLGEDKLQIGKILPQRFFAPFQVPYLEYLSNTDVRVTLEIDLPIRVLSQFENPRLIKSTVFLDLIRFNVEGIKTELLDVVTSEDVYLSFLGFKVTREALHPDVEPEGGIISFGTIHANIDMIATEESVAGDLRRLVLSKREASE